MTTRDSNHVSGEGQDIVSLLGLRTVPASHSPRRPASLKDYGSNSDARDFELEDDVVVPVKTPDLSHYADVSTYGLDNGFDNG